jgi:hypothetical protein
MFIQVKTKAGNTILINTAHIVSVTTDKIVESRGNHIYLAKGESERLTDLILNRQDPIQSYTIIPDNPCREIAEEIDNTLRKLCPPPGMQTLSERKFYHNTMLVHELIIKKKIPDGQPYRVVWVRLGWSAFQVGDKSNPRIYFDIPEMNDTTLAAARKRCQVVFDEYWNAELPNCGVAKVPEGWPVKDADWDKAYRHMEEIGKKMAEEEEKKILSNFGQQSEVAAKWLKEYVPENVKDLGYWLGSSLPGTSEWAAKLIKAGVPSSTPVRVIGVHDSYTMEVIGEDGKAVTLPLSDKDKMFLSHYDTPVTSEIVLGEPEKGILDTAQTRLLEQVRARVAETMLFVFEDDCDTPMNVVMPESLNVVAEEVTDA